MLLCIAMLLIIRPESIEHTTIGSPVYQAIKRPLTRFAIMTYSVNVVRSRRYNRKHIDAGTGPRWSVVSACDALIVFEHS